MARRFWLPKSVRTLLCMNYGDVQIMIGSWKIALCACAQYRIGQKTAQDDWLLAVYHLWRYSQRLLRTSALLIGTCAVYIHCSIMTLLKVSLRSQFDWNRPISTNGFSVTPWFQYYAAVARSRTVTDPPHHPPPPKTDPRCSAVSLRQLSYL